MFSKQNNINSGCRGLGLYTTKVRWWIDTNNWLVTQKPENFGKLKNGSEHF